MHVLCCGLPLVMSISSLATLIGLSGADAANHTWFEPYETPIMIVAGVLLLFSAGVVGVSKIIDCRKQGACVHKPCDKKKDFTNTILATSALVYMVNIALYFSH
jgi:hypothetical protein